MIRLSGCLVAPMLMALAISCGDGGASGRKVEITQSDNGCTPSTVPAQAGEKLSLVVKNASGSGDYRLERISGPPLQDLSVPQGGSRSAGYSLPAGDGTYKLSCFVLGGVSTTVQVVAGKGAPAEATSATSSQTSTPAAGATPKTPDVTVAVRLADFTVTPDRSSVPAGTIRFNATNAGPAYEHELVLHRVNPDGSGDLIGKAGDIHTGESKSLTADLTPGTYRLACFILTPVGPAPEATLDPTDVLATQEAGKGTVQAEPDPEAHIVPGQPVLDHYQLGMHVVFTVE